MIQANDAFVEWKQQACRLRRLAVTTLAALTLSLALSQCGAPGAGVHHEVISHGQFAQVRILRPPGPARVLVLLLSGDGGWSGELEELARRLNFRGAMVAGIDTREWLDAMEQGAATCAAPGPYLSDLAHFLREKYGLPELPLVLVGHSAGATLAYVALAQARARTFAGAVTLAFCTDLDLAKPLCPAPLLRSVPESGGARLQAGQALPAPWITLHGLDDRECPAAAARAFAAATPGARFMAIPQAGHAYDPTEGWTEMVLAAYAELAAAPAPAGRP